jgi:hypothetical protein
MRIHSPQITGSAENTNIVTITRITSLSALSASFASTASYWSGSIINAASASYWSGSIINAESASYALTASYAANVPETASYALQANSASFALTASYISGSGGGVGFPFSGSAVVTGSLYVSGSTISGSFVGDGSGITGLTAGGKIHTQSSAASTWTVTHNLGVQYPNVTVYNASNEVIIPQTITATDANTLTLTFGSAVAGYAVSGIGGIINVQGRTTQQYFTAATTWSFAHNLGDKYVSIQAFDDAFEMMIPTTIRLVDATSSIMLFDSASSGYAVATIGGDLPAISSSYAGYTLQVANSAPFSASWVAVPNVTVTTAQTASYANNFTVGGTLTAQTINVQTITSSIDFVTGSTRNGTLLTNTHEFTGSVSITSSAAALLNVNNGVLYVSSSGNIGIGVTSISPISTYKTLEIRGATGGGIKLGKTGFNPLNIQHDGTDAYINNVANGSFNIYTNDTPRFSISSAGVATFNSTLSNGTYTYTLPGATGTLALTSQLSNYMPLSGETMTGGITINATSGTTSSRFRIIGTGVSTFLCGQNSRGGVVRGQGGFDELSFWTGGTGEEAAGGGGTERMRISGNGSIGAGGSTTNIYNASDIRLKKNITPITYGLNTISALNPVGFNWADGFDWVETDKTLLGFIAQEVQEVLPEAVEAFSGETKLNDTIITDALRVNEKFIIPVLVKAIQELKAENDTLKEILQRNNIQ